MTQMTSWGERYLVHYENFFGDYVDALTSSQDDDSPRIQVLTYGGVFSGCTTFCTLGLSHYREEIGCVAELILVAAGEHPELVHVVAQCAFYLAQNSQEPMNGYVVDGLENAFPDFCSKTGKNAVVYCNPVGLPSSFAEVPMKQEKGVMAMVVPICYEEGLFIKQNGMQAFEEKAQASKADPFDLCRPCAV